MLKAWSLRYHATWWLRTQLFRSPWPKLEHPLQTVLPRHNLDVFFSMAVAEQPLTSVPCVTWIPDLQHRRLPDNFPPDDRASRDRIYLAEARHATRIMVTSDEVKQDLLALAPDQAAKVRTLAFVAHVPEQVYDEAPPLVLAAYHLPERFIYLPNQFWQHKNHKLVFEALRRLRARGVRPTIACTR